MLVTFRLKVRYLFTTSLNSFTLKDGGNLQCVYCKSTFATGSCGQCLDSIATSSAWLFKEGYSDRFEDFHKSVLPLEDVDPYADLAILGATCLLKLAGLNSTQDSSRASRLQGINVKPLLQAVAWLDFQYQKKPKGSTSLRIILMKLYILIGCVSHAKNIWETLEVKNVTLDALGPLFSDRLSTMVPGIVKPSDAYRKFYSTAFTRSLPANIRSALDLANYGSVLGLLETTDRLERSCTLTMAVTEGRRSLRFNGVRAAYPISNDELISRSH